MNKKFLDDKAFTVNKNKDLNKSTFTQIYIISIHRTTGHLSVRLSKHKKYNIFMNNYEALIKECFSFNSLENFVLRNLSFQVVR